MGCENVRFIGCKNNLLRQIEAVIDENITCREGAVLCDIFSGTGAVAKHFKNKYRIYSNDSLYFSYVLQKATVENNAAPSFAGLRDVGILDPFAFLEDTDLTGFEPDADRSFITRSYSPFGDCGRMYFTVKNAMRIDFVRTTIEAWRSRGLIDEHEYFYLLAALIDCVPSVSNITGTYGAYLKTWDKRSFKKLELSRLDVYDNGRENRAYNRDALELIDELEGDILYLDPPYNERQYAPNYHLLETIARYDSPEITGVTGMRPYSEQKSPFCVRSQAAEALGQLIARARFCDIVMNYSTDGIMSADTIADILTKYCDGGTLRRYDIPYRKYRSRRDNSERTLYENIFYVRKRTADRRTFDMSQAAAAPPDGADATAPARKYIKSPTNYIGGKFRQLGQLLPLFPKDIGTFVDLFAGGCNVGINVKADKVIFNDLNSIVMDLFELFRDTPSDELLRQIDGIIDEFGLSKTNEDGFLRLRRRYNDERRLIDLYTLSCYSFNYQFRFNSRHEYNNPFGRSRSHFSQNMRDNLIRFAERLRQTDAEFSRLDFEEFDVSRLGAGDFVYCDPPFLITTGSYNDGNRGFKNWGEREETALYAFLDRLDSRGIRFALSNVLEHKGRANELLREWSEKYRVIDIDSDYSNSSYNTAGGVTREVLIVNY